MIEVVGNLWTYQADAKVVTTNGYVRKDGAAVMGRGVARQATRRYKGIEHILGAMLKQGGNRVYLIAAPPVTDFYLLSFPVKHYWYEVANLHLIRTSANQLLDWVNGLTDVKTIVVPRPGCGNGQLNWSDVKPMLEDIWDDRFHVIELPAKVSWPNH